MGMINDTSCRPILVGVSEGAGLSVIATTDPRTNAAIRGIVGVGLPDLNACPSSTSALLEAMAWIQANAPR
jgi:hypothetical protein